MSTHNAACKNHDHLPEAPEDLEGFITFVDPPADRSASALDVATGSGKAAAALAPFVRRVLAVDLAEAALERARERFAELGLTNIETQVMDAAKLTAADRSFDIVTCRYGAHHIEDVPAALLEIRRVLKYTGFLVIEDKISPDIPAMDGFINQLGRLRDASYIRAFTRAEWLAMLSTAGFGNVTTKVRKETRDISRWLSNSGLPETQKAAIRSYLAAATPEAVEHFSIRERDGVVVELTDDHLFIKAQIAAGSDQRG